MCGAYFVCFDDFCLQVNVWMQKMHLISFDILAWWCHMVLVIIGSGNSLVPDGTKLLPDPVLSCYWLDHCDQIVVQFQSWYTCISWCKKKSKVGQYFFWGYCQALPCDSVITEVCSSGEQLTNNQGLYSLSGWTSYCKILWNVEAANFSFRLFQMLWNLTSTQPAVLPRWVLNFRAIW